MSTPPIEIDLLPAVEIPGMQPPIAEDIDAPENPAGPADGGIGLRHVEHPLTVRMQRPPSSPLGTEFHLFWGDHPIAVASNIIHEGDEELSCIPFTVFPHYIREFWADPVYAQVKRPGGNPSETKPLRLRVNLRRPGGRDPDDDEEGNQNLIFELPEDVVLNGVNDERARLGVEIVCRHWVNMAAYDLILVAWGSQTVSRRVTVDEVDEDISVLIDYSLIALAGNGDFIPVAFQVIGPTGNYPDEWARWSARTRVDVHLNVQRPNAPRVVFPVIKHDVISLAELGSWNVRLQIDIDESDAQHYLLASLIWAGKDRDGNSVPATPSQPISEAGTYDFEIDNALVVAIAKGTVVVHYLLQAGDLPDKRSYNLHLRVVGEVSEWPAPTIDQQMGNELDPNLPIITIRLPRQASWHPSDTLTIAMLSGSEDDTVEYTDSRPVGDSPPRSDLTFDVPGNQLRRFQQRLTEVFYSVTRGTGSPMNSLRRVVQVGKLTPALRDFTSFDNRNWNSWANKVSVRGELAIDGAQNVCWRASKTAAELIEPGIEKAYAGLKNSTQYEISFYCKTTGSTTPSSITTAFAGETSVKTVMSNRNWEKFSHTFTTPAVTPAQTQNAVIYFSVNTAATFFLDEIQVLERSAKRHR